MSDTNANTSSRTDSATEEVTSAIEGSPVTDSWDSLYNDQGDCLNPEALEALVIDEDKQKPPEGTPSKPSTKMPQHCFTSPYDVSSFGHIVELYDFPDKYTTQDLMSSIASVGSSDNVTIKWVDDTHALAVFRSPFLAEQALVLNHPFVKIRLLSEALPESMLKAKQCVESSEPLPRRPDTSSVLARRLVSNALGLRVNISKEQREKERQKILEARTKKQQAAKQRRDAWDGAA